LAINGVAVTGSIYCQRMDDLNTLSFLNLPTGAASNYQFGQDDDQE